MFMKKFILLLSLIIASNILEAQNWYIINTSRFTCQMPLQPYQIDTLNTLYCALDYDSNIIFQVYRLDSVVYNHDSLLDQIPGDTNYNIFELFSKTTVLLTNSDIVFLVDSNSNLPNVPYRELGIHYNEEDYGSVFTFIRMYYFENTFLTFSITGRESDLTMLYNLKNTFFSSIYLQ